MNIEKEVIYIWVNFSFRGELFLMEVNIDLRDLRIVMGDEYKVL